MSTFSPQLDDRRHIRLLLHWRWLVLAVAIPVSLVIELLEGDSHGLHFLDEVIIDGLMLPLSTWIVLTFAARRMARQFEQQDALERRQRFTQRLAEHREYGELTRFLVRFPSTLMPIDHISLFIYDQDHGRLNFATEWNTPGKDRPASARPTPVPATCLSCLASAATKPAGPRICGVELSGSNGSSEQEYCLPLAHSDILVAVLRMRSRTGKPLRADQLEFLVLVAPEMALALDLAIEDARHAERAYREAQMQERRRITHELHDSLAQQVFYLHLGLDQLAGHRALVADDTLQRRVESMRDVAADVYEQVRNNLSILRAWEKTNITDAISRLARVTAHNADLTVEIDIQGDARWLSPHTCEDIYGIVREALNNIVKHASAQRVRLSLVWSDEFLRISVIDDGVGFDPQHIGVDGHYGLALMRETLDALDGEFTVDSRPANGTELLVTIPLRGEDSRHMLGEMRGHESIPVLDAAF